jgi:hypothetical protein
MLSPLKQLLLNTTFWIGLVTLAIVLVDWIRFWNTQTQTCRVQLALRSILCHPAVLIVLVSGSVTLAGIALYMSYVAPWDIMQDIVSAQQLLRGESPYPANMETLMRTSLQSEPPRISLGQWLPRLKQKEESETGGFLFNGQAHPPHLIFLAVPFVALLGVHTAVLAMNLLSLVALCVILVLIRNALCIELPTRLAVGIAAIILGWSPVVNLLREGQSGLLVAALIVIAWFYLRRGEEVRAGIALGIATCLKLYPGLLLVYLLFRYRRALVAATVSCLLLVTIPLVWLNTRVYLEYFNMIRTVMIRFGGHPLNLSLLGVLRKSGFALGNTLFAILAICVIAGLVSFMALKSYYPPLRWPIDLEYSTLMTLMLLLSPIAWDHYLVILILPIIVLGDWVLMNPRTRWHTLCAFLLLVTALSIPVDSLVFVFLALGKPWMVNPLAVSIPTLALVSLTVWLITLQMKPALREPVDDLSD